MVWAAEGRGVASGRAAVQIYPANAAKNLVVLFRWRTSNEKDELQMKQCRRATEKLYRSFFPGRNSSFNFSFFRPKTLGFRNKPFNVLTMLTDLGLELLGRHQLRGGLYIKHFGSVLPDKIEEGSPDQGQGTILNLRITLQGSHCVKYGQTQT